MKKKSLMTEKILLSVTNRKQLLFPGFTHELPFSGSLGVCTPVPQATTFSIQHFCSVGLRHGGLQDVLPAQSHQTS